MSLFACFGGRKREVRRPFDYWDCSNLGLSDLPKEVLYHRRTLRQLTLATNNIKDVPKSIFTFEQLTELDLSENVILFLPPSIRSLRSLTSLNISKNSLSTIPDSIRECQDLLHLDVSANTLGSIPEGLTELRQLRTLALNDCQLEQLPPNIGKLNKLESLELRENVVATLPQSICHLTLLERLDLGVNEIDTLSGVIGSLESLSELWLDGNLLNSLPDEIGSLRNLKFLEVSENQLMFLPLSISSLVSLQDLHLSDNLLSLLPENMGELRNLKLLKVERNRLTALPQSTDGWTSLVELSLSQNFLEELPDVIGGLGKLETLILDENSLFSLPAEIGELSSLNILSLRSNNLIELPEEVGQLTSLSVLNVVGNRLQFLPFCVTTLTNLTALWIAENQNRPLLELQMTRSGDGQKMLTCILLPQRPSESPMSSDGNTPELNRKPHPTTVNFDPNVQDPKSKLTRDPTPYPKELHVKALQWRAAREEAAAAPSQDKSAVPTNVPLRNSSRSRSIHRPYSLMRAMSDPIEPGDLVGAGSARPSSRRRERSHERRELSQSPARTTPGATPVMRDCRSSRGERPVSSPSPPPLAVPAYYSPGHSRHQISEEAEWLIERQPNGTRGAAAGVPHYPTPQQASPGGDELHTALLASNSNSNNNNNRRMASTSPPPRLPPSSASRLAMKSNTYPPTQPTSHSTTTFSWPPSASGRSHLQSTPHAQSEASTLSHSDTANPRYSSSLESGFDVDMEQDQPYWYMTETSPGEQQPLIQLQQLARLPGAQRRRHMSDSTAARGCASSAPQGIRRGSADDYDHLERCSRANAGAYRQKYSSSCSPVTRDPRAHQLATRHQKASRSFDVAELPTGPLAVRPAVETRPSGTRGPQPVSFTAAAKAARNGHSRSKSDPDDLIAIEKATPISGHAHKSARGSLSPTPVNPYFVNVNMGGDIPGSSSHSNQPVPLISPVSNFAYQRLTGPGRKRGGADHTPHRRYPSSSDKSHSRGRGWAEPDEQATPKSPSKVNSTHTYIHV
jgi:Leucine-rich repeat (LRR) protein